VELVNVDDVYVPNRQISSMGSRSIPNNSNFQPSSDEESYAHVVVFETTVSDPNRPIRPPTKKSQNDMTTAPIISVGNSHEGFKAMLGVIGLT
jgi:hypothetical protein